jgi:hypothetical protein
MLAFFVQPWSMIENCHGKEGKHRAYPARLMKNTVAFRIDISAIL